MKSLSSLKSPKNPEVAKTGLINRYKLSEIQAKSILEMRLQRLTGLERDKIIRDYEDIMKEIDRLEGILASQELVNKIITEEFEEVLKQYADERRTQIEAVGEEIVLEDLIKEEDVIVTITHKGYIKRMALNTYQAQGRGGKGVKGSVDNEEDFITDLFVANTHTPLFFFTNKGTVFSRKVYEIPEASRTAKGRNIVNIIPLPAGERICGVIPVPKENWENHYLLIGTEKGLIKRTVLSEYKNIRQSGIRGIKVLDGDNILSVRVTNGKKHVLICSSGGKSIRFSEEDCRPQGRVSQGVKGIAIDSDENVVGMEVIEDRGAILSVSEKGYGKRTEASEFRIQSRGGKGIIAMKTTDKTGPIVQLKPVSEKEDIVIVTNTGQVIRIKVSDISLIGRNTQGVRLINLKVGEQVVSVEKIIEEDEG